MAMTKSTPLLQFYFDILPALLLVKIMWAKIAIWGFTKGGLIVLLKKFR